MSGFSATRASRRSLSPCCWRASANVFASAQVSRNVPPLDASSVIIPAVGGPSRTSSHSSLVKSALLVIASPFTRAASRARAAPGWASPGNLDGAEARLRSVAPPEERGLPRRGEVLRLHQAGRLALPETPNGLTPTPPGRTRPPGSPFRDVRGGALEMAQLGQPRRGGAVRSPFRAPRGARPPRR